MNVAALTGYSISVADLFNLPPRDIMVFEEAVAAAQEGRAGGDEH